MATFPMSATRSPQRIGGVAVSVPTWGGRKCVTHHAAVVLAAIGLYFLLSPASFLIASGLLVAPYFFFMIYVEGKRAPLRISPISVYFVWQAFALGVSAIYMGIQLQDGAPIAFGWHQLGPKVVASGYLIGLIGTLPLHAGMQVTRPKPEPPLAVQTTAQVTSLLTRLAIMYGFGLAILTMGSKLRFLGTLTSCFEFAAHAAVVGFVLIPRERLKLPESSRLGIVLLSTGALVIASASAGAKLYFMFALVGLLVYVLQDERLKRHIPVAAFLFILFYLSVVAPTVTKSRDLRSRYSMDLITAQIEGFKAASPLYTGKVDTEFYADQVETLLKRQFEAISIAFIVQDVQVKGYLNGETFYQLRYALIPRFIWPDKPWVVRGGWFTSYTGASPREEDSTFAVGMEAAGELYWNFGILGMLVGMFVLGTMLGGLWRLAGADSRTEPLRLSLYIYVSLGMMNMPEAASRMVACLSLFMIYGTAFFLLRPHKQSKQVVFQRTELPGSA